MVRWSLLVLPLALASGCLSSGVSGVWLFDVPYAEGDEDPCTAGGTENFLQASFTEEAVPSGGDWTFEVSASGSDTLYFGQIVTTTGGEAVLVIGEETYPGTKEDGDWVFSWEDIEETVSSAVHVQGYTFEEASEVRSEVTFRFGPDGATASGKVEATAEEEHRLAETDEWSAANVGLPYGQIPTNDLEADGGGGVANGFGTDECEGDTCRITTSTTCSSQSPFTATRTDHDPDAYEYLVDAGQ